MPRNDPRTQRGLAVARHMRGESLRSTIEKAARPRPAPQVSQEVRREQAAAELAAAGRKLSPQDVAGIERVYQFRGWPAVRQALLQARVVSEDALRVADSIVQSHGLEGLGTAVRERIQHEDVAHLQAEAEPHAAALLASLSPADLAEAARILAAGGPEALAAKAAELGVPPAVATIAVHTIAAHGPEGARQAAVQHVQAAKERAAAEEADKATVEAWTPAEGDSRRARAVKEGSPIATMLRDPEFRAAAGQMAQRLVAAGIEKPAGTSDALFVVDTLERLDGGRVIDGQRKPFDPRWTAEQRLSAVTEILGGTDVPAVRKVLATFKSASEGHRLIDRMAQSDEKRPAPAKDAPVDGVRASVEAAVRKHGAKEKPIATGNLLQSQIAVAAGKEFTPSRHAEREITKYVDGIDNPKPDTSVRGAIEAAVAAEEDDETGGGTDE